MTDDAFESTPEQGRTEPTGRWTVQEPGSIHVDQLRRLRIEVAKGDVEVIGRDEPGAGIEVHDVPGLPLQLRLDDGVLRIGSGHGTTASITVAVQRDVPLELTGVTASLLVSGMKKGMRVQTVSGAVLCDATAGSAQVEGVSGELALREHEGPLELTTVSGDATASGAVPRFDGTAVSGDLFLDLQAPDHVEIRTVSGDVVLRLGTERPADYTVRSISGGLVLDGEDVGRVRGGYRGSWGAGDTAPTRVRVSGASGTVRIVHTDET
jgi:DUF4097 and DUF4098 domain-containing protein YvlB